MIQFFLITLLVLALTSAVSVFAAIIQGKKAKKALAETQTLRIAFGELKTKAERLKTALDKTAAIEGEANAVRKELEETLDSDLVGRANNLFS